MFKGADVVLLIDNDKAGRARIDVVAGSLQGIARRVRVLDLSEHWSAMPEKGDVTDWVNFAGGTADQLYEIASTLPSWRPDDGFTSKLGLVLWRDLNKPKDPLDYLIKGWLTAGEVSILAGPSGSGKSFLTLDIAMAIARGVPFLGKYRVKQASVVYQAGEGAKGLRDRRIPAYMQKNGLSFADEIPFALLPRPINLFLNDDDTALLIADVTAAGQALGLPVGLVVVDTTSAATPGADENSAKDVSPVLERCNRIARETKAHVLLVAHMNADGKKVRGHTSWHANVDTVIQCRVEEELRDAAGKPIRVAEIKKQKDGEDGIKTRFVLPAITIGQDADGDEIRSCTVEEPDEGEVKGIDRTTPTDRKVLTDQQFGFIKCMEMALDEHGVEATSVGVALPYGMKVVEFEVFKKLFAETEWETDEALKDNTVRTAIRRAGKKLWNLGLVGRRGAYVWRTGKPIRSGATDSTPPHADVPRSSPISRSWSSLVGGFVLMRPVPVPRVTVAQLSGELVWRAWAEAYEAAPETQRWTRQLVAGRLKEMMLTLARSVGRVGPKRYGAGTPRDYIKTEVELFVDRLIAEAQGGPARVSPVATAAEMSRMEEALDWLPRYMVGVPEGELGALQVQLACWQFKHSLSGACRAEGLNRDTVKDRIERACLRIALGLIRDEVPTGEAVADAEGEPPPPPPSRRP